MNKELRLKILRHIDTGNKISEASKKSWKERKANPSYSKNGRRLVKNK